MRNLNQLQCIQPLAPTAALYSFVRTMYIIHYVHTVLYAMDPEVELRIAPRMFVSLSDRACRNWKAMILDRSSTLTRSLSVTRP